MSTGMIAAKYASALLKFVDETGNGEKVFNQVQVLDSVLEKSEELRHIVGDPVSVGKERKIEACALAVGEPIADELSRFLQLVIDNGRIPYLRFILRSLQERYLKSRNICIVELTTAVPSEELGQKITDMVRKRTGGEVILHSHVDPDLVGGFVFKCDDLMLDASVRHQLDTIRNQFIERNTRIV